MNAIPQISLAEFSFSYRAQQHIAPSLLTPSLWHGVFGHALRQGVCLVPEKTECKSCLFLQQCDYPYLFEGVKPLNAQNTKSSPDIPAPHIFKTVTEQTANQQLISISVILLGKATQRLSVLIEAMALAGSNGIGKSRIPLELMQVKQKSHPLSQLILENDILYKALPAHSPLIPDAPPAIQLLFKTPYRSNKADFDKVFFLMQIIRRVSSIQNFYTSRPLIADFKHLKILANKADVDAAVYSQQDSRYSARHQRELDTSGFMGKITINMKGMETLWPYIYLGQWLHVGKNASFGYGRYELLSVS